MLSQRRSLCVISTFFVFRRHTNINFNELHTNSFNFINPSYLHSINFRSNKILRASRDYVFLFTLAFACTHTYWIIHGSFVKNNMVLLLLGVLGIGMCFWSGRRTPNRKMCSRLTNYFRIILDDSSLKTHKLLEIGFFRADTNNHNAGGMPAM